MTWLLGMLWPLLLASFALGAATVVLWGLRRESVEVWEDVPLPSPSATSSAGLAGGVTADGSRSLPSATAPGPIDTDDPDSPFPVAPTDGPAPWEQEELWSRPARVSSSGEARQKKDEWATAAENWRSWADEATGRGYGAGDRSGGDDVSARDRALFAADREVEPPQGQGGPGPDQPGDETFPADLTESTEGDDPFPFARPVEAPAGGDETMDPMDTPELTEDEREAAEIRRLREQARRGDTA